MPTDHRAVLANIKTLPQLIAYLRDQMGWPIEQDSFVNVDDLFYDFTADELGIDPRTSAKISEIKRLKPLSTRQPWGVFFVKFEPKKLPVVALRRILSQVALKKRPSANSAERTAWAADDLLFVSNYGEGAERQISFAHFAKPQDGRDLPTLKVLGWDNRDTALHLDAVAQELTEHLAWPDDDTNAEAWRAQWRAAFTLGHREVVTTSKELSIRLAELARNIRDRIKTSLAIETEKGPLTRLMMAFQTALVHDLDADGFADMYAQTIAYGLLSARIADPTKKTADDFAAHMRTNPFLRELMEIFLSVGGRRGKAGGPGIDFDELGVSEVVQLLDDDKTNMEAVVRDFGDKNPQEDPVIHFYESFLREYDAKERMQRGIFYTPRPVVSFIVRSVDKLLRSEFGLEDGLADTTTWREFAERHGTLKIPKGVLPEQAVVQILDPATGTGTFLVEVIDLVHETMIGKWARQGMDKAAIAVRWNEYVPRDLLPRLHAYELLMAPYAIAHLKVGLKLYETGYRFESEERARIYLTNALAPASSGQIGTSLLPALAHEANAVDEIKRTQRFTVVLGNPPYAGHSVNNQIDWIVDKVYDYKRGFADLQKPGQAKWLQDDYVKFIRLAEHLLAEVPIGTLGYITNHSYLDNATFKGMRRHLMKSFERIAVLDLHGNSKKKETLADGTPDKNVFEIQQGVAVMLACRGTHDAAVAHGDLLGTREQKYSWLLQRDIATAGLSAISPAPELYLFRKQDMALAAEYAAMLPLDWIMAENGDPAPGIVTTHDEFAISWTREEAVEKVERFLATRTEAEARKLFTLCSQDQWNYARAKRELRDGQWRMQVIRILYRPFDWRWTVFNPNVAVHRRERVMRHMIAGENVGLICTRQTKDQWGAFVTRDVCGHKTCGAYDINYLFPLELQPPLDELALVPTEPRPNISKRAIDKMRLALPPAAAPLVTPANVFDYMYGVFHCSGFRRKYEELLRSDFPRVPVSSNPDLFQRLVSLGGKLVRLHLMETEGKPLALRMRGDSRAPVVERVGWCDDSVWLDAPATSGGLSTAVGTIGFAGVSREVWEFHVGGYQVCEKWLKDRKGRTLSKDDIAHYQRIVVALTETIRLMAEIDVVIEQHGGWPGAFRSESPAASAVTDNGLTFPSGRSEDSSTMRDERAPITEAAGEYSGDLFSPAKVAEAPERSYDSIDDVARQNVMARIREVFSAPESRDGLDREAILRQLCTELGFERLGPKIRETLEGALLAASRRRIVETRGGQLFLSARSIEAYDREFLKEQFLASLAGYAWVEREDAIRGFARWLGFRRTGRAIDEQARSLVNGLLRTGGLESDGSSIRRSRQ
ncbi:MAG: type ISP restriction/modification enzyme [Gemmatimonadaceae bacterium]|jgi:hypothetical protein